MRTFLPAVYITASGKNGTLYTGVSSDLVGRIYQHKNGTFKGFSSEYGCTTLVYYEILDTMEQAIKREKCIKEWKRVWKLELIEKNNPGWDDLYESIL